MSAFLSSQNHLSLIANAASAEPVERDNAFALLVADNLCSHYPCDHEDHVACAGEMTCRDAAAYDATV